MRLPDFVIVGAMRSGTSSLARWLRDHPDVFIPAKKELHFFDSGAADVDGYQEHFAPASPLQRAGEATPSYLFLPEARVAMARVLPNARFVAILRDPVDRAYSHYWHERERGQETEPFETALRLEAERLEQSPDARLAFSYQARGEYAMQLEALAGLVGRDRIHVEFFDDLTNDPAATFARVCGFLGIPEADVTRVGTPVNTYTELRSKTVHQWSRGRHRAVQKIVGRLNAVTAGYPPMPSTARSALVRHFAGHNDRLADWLGRAVPWADSHA